MTHTGTTQARRPAWADDLPAAIAHALALLARGVGDRRSPFRTPTLATAGAEGPQARSVVLRGFDPASLTLRIHTDRRSAKVAAIEADPRVALHAWDSVGRVQLRLAAVAQVHADDAVARQVWQAMPQAARRDYAAALPPGTPVPAPPAAPAAATPENFAVLLLRLRVLDLLWLGTPHHVRAQADWTGAAPHLTWKVP